MTGPHLQQPRLWNAVLTYVTAWLGEPIAAGVSRCASFRVGRVLHHAYIHTIYRKPQSRAARRGCPVAHPRRTPAPPCSAHCRASWCCPIGEQPVPRTAVLCAVQAPGGAPAVAPRAAVALPSPPEIPEHMLGHPAHPQRMIALMYSCALGSAPVIGQRRFNSAQHHGKAVLQVCGRCGGVRVRYVWPQGVAPILGSAG